MNKLELIKSTIKTVWKNPGLLLSPKNLRKFYKRWISKTKNSAFYNPYDIFEYNEWLRKKDINNLTAPKKVFNYNPKISIIVPVYNAKRKYLEKCINSVLNQDYENWELCLVDDCSTNVDTIDFLSKLRNIDDRIKINRRTKNGNISKATNDGIAMSTGKYIGLLDNDDTLETDALSNIVYELNKNRKLDFIYTDEDKIDESDKRFDPFFKPDWSPDTMLSYNYICHFVVIKKRLILDVGGFRSQYDGCQDYDLFLRIVERKINIYHVPKILYHWRAIDTSTAKDLSNKENITIKTKKMLEETLKRRKVKADVEITAENNFYIKYQVTKKEKISIIIPTRDHIDLLSKCIDSILSKTTYQNYEIIIVNNNSQERETINKLIEYQKNPKIKIIDLNCEFNYSYINNQAIKQSKGKYIVLLNNDTEIISENWLDEMIRYASQKHIGAVGVKLLYEDNTIQHGGIILGLGGVAGHAFIGEKDTYLGPYSILKVNRNVGANTAACLMIEKKKYMEVNGLDEKLKVAFNDVDFNVKLLSKGYYNIFLPEVKLYHYESKSRGLEDTKEKRERFNSEVKYIQKKWNKVLKRDAFYNDNLSYLYNYKIDIK